MDKIQIGIMAQKTEKIIQSTRTMNSVFETQSINDNEMEVFVSLPALFMMQDTIAPHTLVLKTIFMPSSELKVKIFILTPKIENELEIPEETIYQLPKVFADLHGYSKGIYFNNQTTQTMTLILNIEKFLEMLP